MGRALDLDPTHPLTLVRLEREAMALKQHRRFVHKMSRAQLENLEQGFVHSQHRWNDGRLTLVDWAEWSSLEDFAAYLAEVLQEYPDGSYVLLARTRRGRYRSYARFDKLDGGIKLDKDFKYTSRRKVRAVFLELEEEGESFVIPRVKLAQEKLKVVQ